MARTLGDYSGLCRRLDEALLKLARGHDVPVRKIGECPEIFQLEEDGMVEVRGFDWRNKGTFESVIVTPKGYELLNRGGYSDFNRNWEPNLFDEF